MLIYFKRCSIKTNFLKDLFIKILGKMLGMSCAKTKVIFLRRDSKFVNIKVHLHKTQHAGRKSQCRCDSQLEASVVTIAVSD